MQTKPTMIIEDKDKENCYITEEFNKNFTAFHPDTGIVQHHIMALITLQIGRNWFAKSAKLRCKFAQIAMSSRIVRQAMNDLRPIRMVRVKELGRFIVVTGGAKLFVNN